MIKIEIPSPDIVLTKQHKLGEKEESAISRDFGFGDFHTIPRDKGGIILFYNEKEELLFVGKARKLRQRVKKHFEDQVSPIKMYRNEVKKISILIVEDPMEREIYETYIVNKLKAKYNIEKVFYK